MVVGGGELLQDRSSRLYTPFNLLPLVIARLFRRRGFCWGIGIGSRGELAGTTPMLAKSALRVCDGITARDESSYNTLVRWGFMSPVLKLTADSALALARDFPPGPVESDLLGAAPRNVMNRRGGILPLETRRKIPGFREKDPTEAVESWARALDTHIDAHGGKVLLFPFHTGSLSNDDGAFCRLVLEGMRHSGRASIALWETPRQALDLMARCRVMLTTPLHGAILSVVTGPVPVAVPYSSKCNRFMEMAGLGKYVTKGPPGVPGPGADAVLRKAWQGHAGIWKELTPVRERLSAAAQETGRHFARRMIR